MRISLLVISIIIALQATSFLYGAHQRHVYHNTIHQISQMSKPIASMLNNNKSTTPCNCACFCMDEELRYGIIAFMYASAFLLFVGEAVWPAFFSQLFWIVFQSYLCTDQSLANIRNFAIQVLILAVLASHMKCCCSQSSCSQKQLREAADAQEAGTASNGERKQIQQNRQIPAKTQKTVNNNEKHTKQGTKAKGKN